MRSGCPACPSDRSEVSDYLNGCQFAGLSGMEESEVFTADGDSKVQRFKVRGQKPLRAEVKRMPDHCFGHISWQPRAVAAKHQVCGQLLLRQRMFWTGKDRRDSFL